VIIDELDYLVNKSQNVLYQLVEWPGHPGAKLVTVGISNTFDLPDRLLSRVQSRIGLTRLAFQPYNRHWPDSRRPCPRSHRLIWATTPLPTRLSLMTHSTCALVKVRR